MIRPIHLSDEKRDYGRVAMVVGRRGVATGEAAPMSSTTVVPLVELPMLATQTLPEMSGTAEVGPLKRPLAV